MKYILAALLLLTTNAFADTNITPRKTSLGSFTLSSTSMKSDSNVIVELDDDNNGTDYFQVIDGNDSVIFKLYEATGNINIYGTVWLTTDGDFLSFGAGADVQMAWDVTGNDHFLTQVKAGASAAQSGYWIIGDLTSYNLTDSNDDPVIRIVAGDDTKYIDIHHDRTDAQIDVSSGDLDLGGAESIRIPVTTVSGLPTATAGGMVIVSDGASATDCTTGSGSTYNLCIATGSAWIDA